MKVVAQLITVLLWATATITLGALVVTWSQFSAVNRSRYQVHGEVVGIAILIGWVTASLLAGREKQALVGAATIALATFAPAILDFYTQPRFQDTVLPMARLLAVNKDSWPQWILLYGMAMTGAFGLVRWMFFSEVKTVPPEDN